MLRVGRSQDRAGRLDDAVISYKQAVCLAEDPGERAVLIEALRRLGVVYHRRD
jgi:predicted RNA polymerase sigma factor